MTRQSIGDLLRRATLSDEQSLHIQATIAVAWRDRFDAMGDVDVARDLTTEPDLEGLNQYQLAPHVRIVRRLRRGELA